MAVTGREIPSVPRGTRQASAVCRDGSTCPVSSTWNGNVWPEILWCRRWDLRNAAGKGKKERWTEDYARPQRHLSPRVAGWRAAEGEGSGVRTEQKR